MSKPLHPDPRCRRCAGQGWYEVAGMAHDPNCDGSCINCPVAVPQQQQCDCFVVCDCPLHTRAEQTKRERDALLEAAKRLRTWLWNMSLDPQLDQAVRESILKDVAAFDAVTKEET